MGGGSIHHAVQDLFRESHSGGADGQHTLTGLKIGQGLDGFFIAVTEILAHGTVEVDIHQARQSVSALGIHDLFAFLRLCKGHDAPLPDGQAPLLKGVAGGINQSIFDDHSIGLLTSQALRASSPDRGAKFMLLLSCLSYQERWHRVSDDGEVL